MNKVHKIIEPKPPPPPQLGNSKISIEPESPILHKTKDTPADNEELQWIEDATHSGNKDLNDTQAQNKILSSGDTYIPFVRKLQSINDYNKRLLQVQRQTKKASTLPPPNIHPLNIPTPKYRPTQNILHNKNWKTQECDDWMRNKNGGRDIPLSTPTNTSNKHDHDDSIPIACTTGTNRHNNKCKITLI